MRKVINKRWAGFAGLAVAGALVLSACGGGSASPSTSSAPTTSAAPTSSAACTTPTPVKLQLQWFTQAQFAGYYAALDKGYYKDACLDVTIVEGGVDIVPQTELANGNVDYAISWVPKALASKEQGAPITDVAQVFQRSGTLQVSWADSGIKSPADFKGKTIGNWGFGNEYEVFASLTAAGLKTSDVELVQQQFDMKGLLSKEIDAAEAMTYNEYAQLLETINPSTGKLYTPADFTTISYEEVGVGMLQDAIWANTEKLADAAYKAQTQAFVTASLKGWIHCRDNAQECADLVTAAGSKLGKSHQLWMMNEINKLIWPSTGGVGMIDTAAWDQTVEISLNTKNLDDVSIINAAPPADSYTNDFAMAANTALKAEGLDVTGAGFVPLTVELKEGGN